RIEGQQTAAFEICEQLGDAPDILAIPVGNAGNITAYWKGSKRILTPVKRGKSRKCGDLKRKGQRPSSKVTPSNIRKPSPPPSASAIRPAGTKRWRRRKSRGDALIPSPMRKFWPHIRSSPPPRASLPSRLRPPRWPA